MVSRLASSRSLIVKILGIFAYRSNSEIVTGEAFKGQVTTGRQLCDISREVHHAERSLLLRSPLLGHGFTAPIVLTLRRVPVLSDCKSAVMLTTSTAYQTPPR